MKVLLLYNRIPFPLHDGGALAVHSMAYGLKEAGCGLRLFCINASRSYVAESDIPADLFEQFGLQQHRVNTHLHPLAAMWNLLEGSPYHVSRFYHRRVARALTRLLQTESFDVIQLEATFMGVYLPIIRKYSGAKVVLRAHNVDYRIWERLAEGCRQPLKKWYLRLQAARLRQFEEALYQQTDGCLAISPTDASHIAAIGQKPVQTVGMGISLPPNTPETHFQDADWRRCLFLGSLDWQPNQEAVQWLKNELWPAIKKQSPQSSCLVAGKNCPDNWLQPAVDGFEIVGFVPNAQATMQQNPLFLVPMRSGSGIRIKILEALSLGLAVVSTRMGAEGMDVTHGQQLLLAETAQEFADAVCWLQQHPQEAAAMGRRGQAWVRSSFNRLQLSQTAVAFYQQLLAS
jgi:glycosyltransferase involved in cell wall biosynthesis